MNNQEIAKILREIGVYLEMENVPFKPRAYEKVAEVISGLGEPVAEIYKKGGLKAVEDIPGVGVSIASKIEELLKTGHLKYYESLKKKVPARLDEFRGIEGLGPRTIKTLYQKLKIRNLKELESAARAKKIRKLEGFGEKSEENILKSLEFVKKSHGRFVLGLIMPQIREIEARLKKLPGVKRVDVAGSVRRRKETIGDADILITINENPPAFAKATAGKIMDYFVNMPEVARVFARGNTKSAVKLKNGLDVDVRVLPEESYGAGLNYFTGSKDHNIALREVAIKKGWKLSEYGLFQSAELRRKKRGITQKGKEIMFAGRTEEELYKKLGFDYIEPELREMTGELEVALRGIRLSSAEVQAQGKQPGLPKLIGYGDLKGDLQVQTNWTDGANSIEEMALAAMKIGLEYIAITDHTKRLAMTRGLDEKRIQKQWAEIDRLNSHLSSRNSHFKILKGTECDILKDGSMDLSDEILARCDVVGASVHSLFNLSRKDQTERIKRAMSNPQVDIIFHPTGRILNARPAYEVDVEELIKHAKKTKTILEINASDRSDLSDENIRKCVESGVKMAINSDAHNVSHFEWLEYGIAQARRGWAERKDIINAWPLGKMLQFLK